MTRRDLAGGVAILALLVAIFHGPSSKNGFVHDDAWTIVSNPFLRQPGNLLALLGPGPARALVPDAGRPTLVATEILDHALWGLSPRGWHLQNLVWHTATASLFFILAAALAGQFLLPFTAAALFAVHPLHVEAVVAVNCREELLAAFFTLAALGAIGIRRRLLAFVLLLVGVLAKENASMAVVLLVVLDVCWKTRRRWSDYLALLAAAVVGFAWRAWVMGAPMLVSRTVEVPAENRLAVPAAAWAFLRGASNLVVPKHLSPEYEDAPRLLGWLALAVIVGAVAVSRRLPPWTRLAVLGGVAAYLPTSGLVPLANVRADRYMYLPSLALFLGLADLLLRGVQRLAWARRPPLFELPRPMLIVGAFVVVFGLRTLRQGRYWRDDLSLWTRAAAVAPTPRAFTALAEAQLRHGQTVTALKTVRHSLTLADDPHGRELLGIILMQQGDLAGARRELEAALAGTEPHHRAEALNNLGYCELQLGLTDEALARFLEAQRLAPEYDRPWLNAARAYEQKNDRASARRALRALPDSQEARRELEKLR